MTNVIYLADRLLSDNDPKGNSSRSFLHLINSDLRRDLIAKRDLVMSLGNTTATVRESASEHPSDNDHAMILFRGHGPLADFCFSFAIRFNQKTESVTAEVLVSDGSSLFGKDLGVCHIDDYKRSWLDDAYNSALLLISPDTLIDLPSTGS